MTAPDYRHSPPVHLWTGWSDGSRSSVQFETLDSGIEALLQAAASAGIVDGGVLRDSLGVILATWPDVQATDEVLDALTQLIEHRYPTLIASAERLHLLALEARVVADNERGRL